MYEGKGLGMDATVQKSLTMISPAKRVQIVLLKDGNNWDCLWTTEAMAMFLFFSTPCFYRQKEYYMVV